MPSAPPPRPARSRGHTCTANGLPPTACHPAHHYPNGHWGEGMKEPLAGLAMSCARKLPPPGAQRAYLGESPVTVPMLLWQRHTCTLGRTICDWTNQYLFRRFSSAAAVQASRQFVHACMRQEQTAPISASAFFSPITCRTLINIVQMPCSLRHTLRFAIPKRDCHRF